MVVTQIGRNTNTEMRKKGLVIVVDMTNIQETKEKRMKTDQRSLLNGTDMKIGKEIKMVSDKETDMVGQETMRIIRAQGVRMIAIGIEMMIGEIPVGGKKREKIDLLSIMIGILGSI